MIGAGAPSILQLQNTLFCYDALLISGLLVLVILHSDVYRTYHQQCIDDTMCCAIVILHRLCNVYNSPVV